MIRLPASPWTGCARALGVSLLIAVVPGTAALAAPCSVPTKAAAAPAHAAENPVDVRFRALYTQEWAWRAAEFRGDEEDDETAEISAHLPHVDLKTQEMRLGCWNDVLAQLKAIPTAQLSPEQVINYAIYRAQIEALINSQKFKDYEKPLNADSSFWSSLVSTARRTFHTPQDYTRYTSQLNEFPRFFAEQTDNMTAGLARGFTPPAVTLIGRDRSITNITEPTTAEENPFYAPFKNMPATIPAAQQAQLRAAGAEAIRRSVVPAHAALLAFMRGKYLPGVRKTLAAEDLPDGKAYYQAKIKEFTTLDLTPDQIHEIGQLEVKKIHAEMLNVMHETGFSGEFPAFLHFLRTDPQFYAQTAEELLMRAAWIAKEFDGKAKDYFGYLPRSRFAIKPVPADLAPFYTGGRGGPGIYLVNTYDLPSRPLYVQTALTLHESAPGHAFQMSIALEHKDQPEFRQKVYISAYGEGWALYCEKLGVEMGMYETPYSRFGMLTYQMWRAARLVVDTGVHAKGWTREQAQQFLHDNTALADHEIETEVDRYIAWPAQALSYYLGEMTIEKARAKAEQALGAKFNLRAFHDTVLELGSVPMPVLEARIDRFIAEQGKGPYPDLE
jgi:uncharacterized protein (DUF885 family)